MTIRLKQAANFGLGKKKQANYIKRQKFTILLSGTFYPIFCKKNSF
jgi:hypothetical protein